MNRAATHMADLGGCLDTQRGIVMRRAFSGISLGWSYWTTKLPVMVSGWTSQRKKYVPGLLLAGML